MSERVQCVVVGAGVIGLAVARQLALGGLEVVLLEAGDGIGCETSSRNSEVIHAGIYYPPGSRKARLCVAGRQRLYDYCRDHGVPHRACGKLIVATEPGELEVLHAIAARAAANGVEDLRWLEGAEARHLEPAVHSVGALLSPSTGIIDSHALMLAYQGDAEAAGAVVAFRSRVLGGRIASDGIELEIEDPREGRFLLHCRYLVNCAGLHAQALAQRLTGLPAETIPPRYLCKGSYFALQGRQPFQRLIYPVPQSASLGVHVTLDLAGQVRFGPDQEWVETIDYDVDPRRAKAFYAAIRRYWPGLPDGALVPAYAGIRPKTQAPGGPTTDFMIQGRPEHGVPGLVNLYGIESPGLTASLAIAEAVQDCLAA